jgi:protein-disulfide isomerase
MRRSIFLLLVTALLVLTTSTPARTESTDELARIRKQLDAMQQDLQDIKALLRARTAAPPPAQGPQEVLSQPITFSIDGAPFLGSKDAKVTVVEFSDYQCPFCARHVQQTLPAIVKEYIDTGKVKYVFRDFPIPALHPQASKSHEAAHCAGEQGKYWEIHQRLFGNIQAQQPADLTAHARALRLDVRKFEQCVSSGRHAGTVAKAVEEGQRAGVRGTPTMFVGLSTEGRTVKATRMLRGAQPYERFKAAIETTFAGQPR